MAMSTLAIGATKNIVGLMNFPWSIENTRRELEWLRDTFSKTKPHCNVGTIGHIDHGKTTLTGALLAVQAAKGMAHFKSYADIAKGGTVRDSTKTSPSP